MTQAHIGVIGVGTMGSALALNFAEKGQNVALWNLDLDMVDRLIASAGDCPLGCNAARAWPIWSRRCPCRAPLFS